MRINLLPKDERPLRQSQVRWEFLVGLLGLLLFGVVVVFSWSQASQVQDLNLRIGEVQSREIALQQQVQVVQNLRKEISTLEATERSYQDLLVGQGEALSNLMRLTNQSFPRLWLEAVIWEESQVQLIGYTQDMTSLSQYLNHLYEFSEQVLLQTVYAQGNTGFCLFSIAVEGVER
mgnify:CR=1 FL=1